MSSYPWYQVETILRSKGYNPDEIFGFKQNYFDNRVSRYGLDPDDDEIKKKKELFLYGNEKDWDLLRAAKSGLIRGFGEIPETAADAIEIMQKAIPGNLEAADVVEEKLRGAAEEVRERAGPFQPSSLPEKVVGGVSQAPGVAASMAPFAATAALAAPALATVLPAAGTAAAVSALGFGAYEAVRSARGSWGDIAKGGAKGAALGGILSGATSLTARAGAGAKTLSRAGLKGRAATMGAAALGTGAFEAAMGGSPEEVAETAATFALLSGRHKNLYNKLAGTAKKAGVVDKPAIDALFDAKMQADQEAYAALSRGPGKPEKPETPAGKKLKASEVATESGRTFEELMGVLSWPNRWKKIRNQGPPVESFQQASDRTRKTMALLQYVKEKEKAGEIETILGKKEDVEELKKLGLWPIPEPALRDLWHQKMVATAKELAHERRIAREREVKGYPPRQGAAYAITDENGLRQLYTIERVEWDRKSDKQFVVRDSQNPEAQPRFFKSLKDVDNVLMRELSADPEMTVGSILNHGLQLIDTGDRRAIRLGRQLVTIAANRMNKPELVTATKPISAADAITAVFKIANMPSVEGPLGGISSEVYAQRYGHTIMRSFNDFPSAFHAVGHNITDRIVQHMFPRRADESLGDYNKRLVDMFTVNTRDSIGQIFTPEELQILNGLGLREYTEPGSVKPRPTSLWSSYEAEGLAAFYRARLYGTEDELPSSFNSDVGRGLIAKLSRLETETPEVSNILGRIQGVFDAFVQQEPSEKIRAIITDGRGGFAANPVNMLGKKFYQWTFDKVKPLLALEEKVYNAVRMAVPENKKLRNILQYNASSAIGQIGRGSVTTGVFHTPTGQIKTMSLQDSIAKSGLVDPHTSISERGRITNEYAVTAELARIQKYIDLFEASRLWGAVHRTAPRDYKSVKEGDNLATVGEVLDNTPYYNAIMHGKNAPDGRSSLGQYVNSATTDEIRDPITNDVIKQKRTIGINAIEHLAELDKKYPSNQDPVTGRYINGPKVILETISDMKRATDIIRMPTFAGGHGVPIVDPKKLSKEDPRDRFVETIDEKGNRTRVSQDDFGAGIDAQLLLEAERKRDETKRPLKGLRENVYFPIFKEIDDYKIGGKTLKAVDWGNNKKIVDPVTAVTKMVEDAYAESYHNRMMNAIYDIGTYQNAANINFGVPAKTRDVEADIKTGKHPEDRMIVGFKRNGAMRYFQFSDTPEGRMAFNAVKQSGPLLAGHKALDVIFGMPKRAMVLGTTGANIGFLVYTNLIRDTSTSAIQSQIKERRGYIGAIKTIKDFAPFLIKINKELFLYGPETTLARATGKKKEMLESYLRYISSGVKGSSLIGEDIHSREAFHSEIMTRAAYSVSKRTYEDSEKVFRKYNLTSHLIKHPVDMLRQIFTVSEDINRFPEFFMTEKEIAVENAKNDDISGLNSLIRNVENKTGRKLTPEEIDYYRKTIPRGGMRSARNAAEVSVDFKRAGIASRWINELVPFFNPALQGLDKFGRVIFNDKKPSLKNINRDALAIAVQTVTLPTLVFWAMNRDEEWYKELPTWEKLLFWHIKLGDTVFKLPVPFEWGMIFGTLPMAMYDSVYNDAPERIKEQLAISVGSILPWDFPKDIAAVRPLVEAGMNKNLFTGIPIESRAMQRRLPTDRYTDRTLEVYRGAGKFASLLGAPEFLQSPVMIENLTRGYFGSMINGLLSDIESLVTLDPSKTKGGMILSRMVSSTDRPGQSVADFYEKFDTADKAWNTAKRRIEDGDKVSAAKILNKYKKNIGLTSEEIRRIILYGDTSTPEGLLELRRASLQMAELRKQKENEEMTEVAQAILGRDWE